MNDKLRVAQRNSTPQEATIIIPRFLRDNNWSTSIGDIQRELDSLVLHGIEVKFDFTDCRWIDPLPSLSLLIEIVQTAKRGITLTVYFPSVDNIRLDPKEINKPYEESPNRLLLFLAKEGFFAEVLKYDINAYVGGEKLNNSVINECASLSATPSYADAHFIPFRLFDIPELENQLNDSENFGFSARTVENILNGVEVSLHSRCSTRERRHLLYVLRAVLQEFFHNVQDHAYQTVDFRPAAIYVRYRQGGTKLASGPERDCYEDCIKFEIKNCELINRDWLDVRPGCLEVFFLDRGIGMEQKFSNKSSGNFANIMRNTFLEGKSSKTTRRTEHGGLHLLHTLMDRSKDYVRALNDQTWFGSSVPFTRPTSVVAKPIKIPTGKGLIGLAYHLRLSWKASTDEPDTWLRFTENEVSQVWKELCRSTEECGEVFAWYERCHAVDERFQNQEELLVENPVAYILWLPKRGLMKWDILDKLEKLANRISKKCTLVIADIPSMEAAMYKAAMSHSGFHRREEWPARFKRIVLATNRWTFAYAEHVQHKKGMHGFTSFRTDEIPSSITTGIKINVENLSFRHLVVHWLKWHDSKRLWKKVKEERGFFLPEEIIWSENKDHDHARIINGYLDFPATTHNHFCSELYRNALSRVFGILNERDHILISVDRLADPIVHNVYAQEVYDPPEHGKRNIKKVAVGSVLVSGSTLQATGLPDRSIHFFIHGSSELIGKNLSLFHWMPEVPILKNPSPQKRIGNTSAIAPEGWLSIEIPRFDQNEESVGYRHPKECYEDWQNTGPIIVKLGHWHYEGHHDFLTINIPDAVEDAFARNGPLAQFLLQNLLYPLGITQDQIKSKKDCSSDPCAELNILVYRSHPSSERIIEKILSTLNDSARHEAMKWIFPVLPLRTRWGGSTLLVPPRMRNEMLTALQKRKNAIIFDDAAITGRTIQDLLTTLKALEASKIQVVTIANRLRLPAETGAVKYFWRLDIPTMGRSGICPLCQALEVASSLAGKMVPSSAAYEDVQSWITEWSHVSPLNEWDAGLNPLPLQNIKEKNYCYRPSSVKHLCKIRLSRSIGLVIHAAEIHAMTASDDYGLKKIREQNDPAIQIELATSQLLLFGDELEQDLVRDISIEGLLEPLARLSSNSPYGHLAVLTLMRTLTTTEFNQVRLDFADKAMECIDNLKSLSHGQILLAFLISQKLIDWTDNTYYAGTRLLSTRHYDVATKLRSLFRETVTSKGNIHSEPIPVLLNKLEIEEFPSNDLLFNTLNSLAKLQDVIPELGSDWASSDRDGSYSDKRIQLEKYLCEAEDSIRKLTLKENLDGSKLKESLIEARECLANVQKYLYAIADCYFYRITPDEKPKGKKFIDDLFDIWNTKINWVDVIKSKNLSKKPIIELSSDSGNTSNLGSAKWVWVLWHAPLRAIIKDLLMNATHPTKENRQIPDPWASEAQDSAHMWVHVKYEPKFACLSFANNCVNPILIFEEIKKGTHDKTRWNTLTELGGVIELSEERVGHEVLIIQVRLPYAPYLQQPDVTSENFYATF